MHLPVIYFTCVKFHKHFAVTDIGSQMQIFVFLNLTVSICDLNYLGLHDL